jgi:hypothetical protein
MALQVGLNSYVSVVEADSYFADRLFADAWNNATPQQKEQALVTACRSLERQIWIGSKKVTDQPMQFPRRYQFQIHDIWRQWFQNNIVDEFETLYVEGASWWADVDVPQPIKDAQYEEALAMLERLGDARTKLQRAGVKEMWMGNLREFYESGSARGLLSIEAREMVRPWLKGAVSII